MTTPLASTTHDSRIKWLGVLLLLAALVIYIPRVAVTPQPGDGPELAAAAVNGAIVHPPGYPLYSMIARAVVAVFPHNPYHSLAILSAVLQSLAVYLLFLVAFLISHSTFIAGFLTVIWMSYGPVVRTATDVEVFALHHVLVLLIAYLVCANWNIKKRSIRFLLLFGIVGGLASSNHHITILWAPLVLAFLVKRRNWIARDLLYTACGFCIGLSCYLYLLVPRAVDQVVAFPGLTNFNELYLWFIRDGYGTFSLWSGDGSQVVSYFYDFVLTSLYTHWLAWAGLLLLVVSTVRSPTSLKIGLLATVMMHLLFVHQILFPPDDALFEDTAARFYSAATLSMFLCLAYAFRELQATSKFIAVVLICMLAVSSSQVVVRELAEGEASTDFVLQAELDSILDDLPVGAVFVSSTDRISMGLQYAQIVEGRRPDVTLVVRGLLSSAAYRRQLKANNALLASYADHQLADFESLVKSLIEAGRSIFSLSTQKLIPGYGMVPKGIVWKWILGNPTMKDLTIGMLNFCARWPARLDLVSSARTRSVLNRQMSFGTPLSYVQDQLSPSSLKDVFGLAQKSLAKGEAARGALLCRDVVRKIS